MLKEILLTVIVKIKIEKSKTQKIVYSECLFRPIDLHFVLFYT